MMDDLLLKYSNDYKKLLDRGYRIKFIAYFVFVPLTFLLTFNRAYYKFGDRASHYANEILVGSAFLAFVMFVIIYGLSSLDLYNPIFIYKLRCQFKLDLFNYIQKDIPFLTKYEYNKKFNQRILAHLNNSKIFNKNIDEFRIKDWFCGTYERTDFFICELKALKLFSILFHGIFIFIKLNSICTESSKISADDLVIQKYLISKNEFQWKILDGIGVFIIKPHKGGFLQLDNITDINRIKDELMELKDFVHVITKSIDIEKEKQLPISGTFPSAVYSGPKSLQLR